MDDDKIYIPPDYDGAADDDDDDIDDIDELPENEGEIETDLDRILLNEESKPNNTQKMTTPPFPQPNQSNVPRWGQPTQNTTSYPWQQNQQSQTSMWGAGTGSWKPGVGTTSWGSNQSQKEPINRNKKVVFIDFLDGIVETFNSNQIPGLLPRDIYDLTPRFDVWSKLQAFSPERVYMMVPKNLLPSTNGAQGWQAALTYFCCSLSSFLRVPYTNCQILAGSVIGQSKESLMLSVIDDKTKPINRQDIVCIGIYSGCNGQSDVDKRAAEQCGVDYVDLYNLLNNMI